MQKPTLGRIVHFVPPQECVGPKSLLMYAAIIAAVNDDGTVELATFGPNSLYFQHHVHFAEEYTPGHWSWMPFQKEQHAKNSEPKMAYIPKESV